MLGKEKGPKQNALVQDRNSGVVPECPRFLCQMDGKILSFIYFISIASELNNLLFRPQSPQRVLTSVQQQAMRYARVSHLLTQSLSDVERIVFLHKEVEDYVHHIVSLTSARSVLLARTYRINTHQCLFLLTGDCIKK